jgi:hypothetical protein
MNMHHYSKHIFNNATKLSESKCGKKFSKYVFSKLWQFLARKKNKIVKEKNIDMCQNCSKSNSQLEKNCLLFKPLGYYYNFTTQGVFFIFYSSIVEILKNSI